MEVQVDLAWSYPKNRTQKKRFRRLALSAVVEADTEECFRSTGILFQSVSIFMKNFHSNINFDGGGLGCALGWVGWGKCGENKERGEPFLENKCH